MAKETERPLPTEDINVLLHELRTRELSKMPLGGRRFLSAGCSGGWYFRWIADHYQTPIESHIGLEAYSPKPDDLPENVRWIANTTGDMCSVPDKSVDLVFAGQTVEHVWPPDLAGFFLESHRVLEQGGWLVYDSPNRTLTHPLNWIHPQHTAELTVMEAVQLARLAGFGEIRVRGVWLCRDRDTHQLLPLDPNPNDKVWTPERRAAMASDRPEDSFIWWVEARKTHAPKPAELHEYAKRIYDEVNTFVFNRWTKHGGEFLGDGPDRVVRTEGVREPRMVCSGPNVPLRPGKYSARLQLRSLKPTTGIVAAVDGYVYCSNEQLNSIHIVGEQLIPGQWHEVELPMDFTEAKFGVHFRWFSLTDAPLEFRFGADLRSAEKITLPLQIPAPPAPEPAPLVASAPPKLSIPRRFVRKSRHLMGKVKRMLNGAAPRV
jgi:SAM-dependent methyltransferase